MKKPAKKKPSLGKDMAKRGHDSNAMRHMGAVTKPGMFAPQPKAPMKKAKKKG